MSDLPQKHAILGENEVDEAMATVLVHAIIASRPPMRVVDGRHLYAGMSSRAVLALLMSVVDVVATGSDMTDQEIAERLFVRRRTPEDIEISRGILSAALEAAAAISFDSDSDTPTTEAAKA